MLHTDSQTKLFPAHAGVILMESIYRQAATAFPRPRGGDPIDRH